jgi:starvation-inducible DNA-binding protein
MLADSLKVLLGNTFVFYVKTHGFHFNVEGPNFPQYHEFLGNLYEDVVGTIDRIGEHIRTLDSYTPGSMRRLMELAEIQEQTKIPRAELMFAELLQDATTLIACLQTCFDTAVSEKQEGIANYLAERLEIMNKHAWMIRSILKKERA